MVKKAVIIAAKIAKKIIIKAKKIIIILKIKVKHLL